VELKEAARQLNLKLEEAASRRVHRYFALLQEWNERLDLVSPAPPEILWRAHVLDSLLLLSMAAPPDRGRVADVGSGAGLPGLVWACVREDLQVVLLEPRRKRAAFLERAVAELGARNAEVVSLRAEEAARDPAYRRRFDLVVARAVAPPDDVLRWGRGLVREGGRFLVSLGPSQAVKPPFVEVRRPVPWEESRERRAAMAMV
jgi:16S rRNA (guanine527-N7)-methyltransferase